jgi:acyl carrier protein
MTEQLELRVKQLVADVFGLPLEIITIESSQKSVSNWDSLMIINLMMAIESEFGVTLDVDEAVDLLSVKKIIGILNSKGVT